MSFSLSLVIFIQHKSHIHFNVCIKSSMKPTHTMLQTDDDNHLDNSFPLDIDSFKRPSTSIFPCLELT